MESGPPRGGRRRGRDTETIPTDIGVGGGDADLLRYLVLLVERRRLLREHRRDLVTIHHVGSPALLEGPTGEDYHPAGDNSKIFLGIRIVEKGVS